MSACIYSYLCFFFFLVEIYVVWVFKFNVHSITLIKISECSICLLEKDNKYVKAQWVSFEYFFFIDFYYKYIKRCISLEKSLSPG